MERIYIPTLGRINDQVTLNRLPKTYQKIVTLVVQQKESKQMTDLYGDVVENIMVVDDDIGIAKTRDEICRHAGEIRFSMIDDDVVFYRRNQKYQGKDSNMDKSKRMATRGDLKDMFEDINKKMDDTTREKGYIHLGNRRKDLPPSDKKLHDNVFFNAIHHIDGKKLNDLLNDMGDESDKLWTRTKVGEDANFIFEYITRGYENIRYDEFPAYWGCYQDGGCALFRDSEMHNSEHRKLQEYWNQKGNFVVKRKKITPRGNIGEIEEYTHRIRNARRYWLNKSGERHERINT